jgi:very-short-patch-repair endonuclease
MAHPRLKLARRMRRSPTSAEAALWALLRSRGLEGLKFRRQVPLGRYVVDFVCLKSKIVVEADGGIHDAPFYDHAAQAERDAWLSADGFRVLRFKNSDAEDRPHLVIERILRTLRGS